MPANNKLVNSENWTLNLSVTELIYLKNIYIFYKLYVRAIMFSVGNQGQITCKAD